MKIKKDFELVELGDEYLIVPVGEKATSFQGVVALNTEAAFLLKKMKTDISIDELISTLIQEYGLAYNIARRDIEEYLNKLYGLGVIE